MGDNTEKQEIKLPEKNEFQAMCDVLSEEVSTKEDCNVLARDSLYENLESNLEVLGTLNIETIEVQTGDNLFQIITELQSRNSDLLKYALTDFLVEYHSEYKLLRDGAVSEEFPLYKGQIVWIDFKNERPRVVVQGFEEQQEVSFRRGKTNQEILDHFSFRDRGEDEVLVRFMDSEEVYGLNDPNLVLEPGMNLVRKGNELVIETMPSVTYIGEVGMMNGGPYKTWRGVIENGFSATYNNFIKSGRVTRDGGKTFENFRQVKGLPAENIWRIGNDLYVGDTSLIVPEPGWRSVLESLNIDYDKSYFMLKAQEVGTEEAFYLDEVAAILPNSPIKVSYDAMTRTIYWEKSNAVVSELPKPAETKKPVDQPSKPLPTPREKPLTRETKGVSEAIRSSVRHKNDIPVFTYLLGAGFDDITPKSRTELLVKKIENMTGPQFIAFRRKFGASRTLDSFFKRYGFDKIDRTEEIIDAIDQVVNSFSGTTEQQVIDACGGRQGLKIALAELCHHETASGYGANGRPVINSMVFSATYCQGFFQFNWANTKYFKVNPFNAKQSVEAVLALMVQNMKIFHQKKDRYASHIKKNGLEDNMQKYLFGAHNGGWLSGLTGKKTGKTLNPDPYDFYTQVTAEKGFDNLFVGSS